MKKYCVRLAKTGEQIASGTALECTRQMRFSSVSSFRTIVSRCQSGERKNYIIDVFENRAAGKNDEEG